MTDDYTSGTRKVTVSGVGLVKSLDGNTAIVLHFKEIDALVFEVNLHVIARLRQILAEAEQVLRQKPSHT